MKKILIILGSLVILGTLVYSQSKSDIELWGYGLNEKFEAKTSHERSLTLEAVMEFNKACIIVRSFDDWGVRELVESMTALYLIDELLEPLWMKGNVWDGTIYFKENYDDRVGSISIAELIEARKLAKQGDETKWDELLRRITK